MARTTVGELILENKIFLQAILENQNLGKLDHCVKYQECLQRNLLELERLIQIAQYTDDPFHVKKDSKKRKRKSEEPRPSKRVSYWSTEEHQLFLEGIKLHGTKDLQKIADVVGTRTKIQVRTHLTKYNQRLLREKKQERHNEQEPTRQDKVFVNLLEEVKKRGNKKVKLKPPVTLKLSQNSSESNPIQNSSPLTPTSIQNPAALPVITQSDK
eukprot:TRINITY_DN1670_c0_g1_i1.p1 TRINITY_DN1670_c0_g1~~TRINITY_DN1670_c0_g1_i1.p1  ORF type:complete len:213 (-),score=33.99 TRINITY_DN1670_c0_g1_i1:131-769(-)